MITGELKSKVDRLWDTFWTGGISNPLTVVEQISYLLFLKGLDDRHTAKEAKANRLSRPVEDPIFGPEEQAARWSRFKQIAPEKMFEVVRDKAFPFMKALGGEGSSYASNMAGAVFQVPTPRVLQSAVDQIDAIEMDDRDTKGDVYEYVLSHMSSAGKNGQFRTPRHIIKMMVELMAPKPTDTVCDPACGTAGFLVAASEYVRENHPESQHQSGLRQHFHSGMFTGFDFDATMLRIGSMNMMMHGVEAASIVRQDSLTEGASHIQSNYDVVLANPPFKGSLDNEATAKNLLAVAKTKKTELLFIAQILRILKTGGRAAVIVPDGVLFGSSSAHKAIRRALVEDHKLEAMISMPSGVFKPYAGVSTGILVFTKTGAGGTDSVWFYDMQADGYSLDDKRTPQPEKSDLADVLARWNNQAAEGVRAKTDQSFMVAKADIVGNDYDLSINRYKDVVYAAVDYDPPSVILARLQELEREIAAGRTELEGLLG